MARSEKDFPELHSSLNVDIRNDLSANALQNLSNENTSPVSVLQSEEKNVGSGRTQRKDEGNELPNVQAVGSFEADSKETKGLQTFSFEVDRNDTPPDKDLPCCSDSTRTMQAEAANSQSTSTKPTNNPLLINCELSPVPPKSPVPTPTPNAESAQVLMDLDKLFSTDKTEKFVFGGESFSSIDTFSVEKKVDDRSEALKSSAVACISPASGSWQSAKKKGKARKSRCLSGMTPPSKVEHKHLNTPREDKRHNNFF